MPPLIVQGDAARLPLPDQSVDLIVTSPPYFDLRSYTDDGEHMPGQIGAEETPTSYVDALIACTAEWARVLKSSGSMFVNLGDKYSGYLSNPATQQRTEWSEKTQRHQRDYVRGAPSAWQIPYKSLMLLPSRYAIRCIDDLGLGVREEIVWDKRNAMPIKAVDRCRRTHELVFHLTKRPRYYAQVSDLESTLTGRADSVWQVPPSPFKAPPELAVEHSAPFPPELARRAIEGWCPPGGVVLDPFGGTGTTAMTADVLGRVGISVDLSADYGRLASWRGSDPSQRQRVRTPENRATAC